MEVLILVVAAANIATRRLRKANIKMRADHESQVVATLTHARSDEKNNGKHFANIY